MTAQNILADLAQHAGALAVNDRYFLKPRKIGVIEVLIEQRFGIGCAFTAQIELGAEMRDVLFDDRTVATGIGLTNRPNCESGNSTFIMPICTSTWPFFLLLPTMLPF